MTEMHDDVSVTSEVQVKQLEAKMAAQSKQLEHSTEVARESEATALRLADQNKVLKEEIRRLEKNQVMIAGQITGTAQNSCGINIFDYFFSVFTYNAQKVISELLVFR